MLETPEAIRRLQRKLYLKAKQEPKCRFYTLYDKISRGDILRQGYRLVKAQGGAPGIDGEDFAKIETKGVEAVLKELGELLQAKQYRAQPVKRVMIPKPRGGNRSLGIPTIRDRIVQMAVKLVIEPIFEADFSDRSYGFRPKRSAHDAIGAVQEAMLTGHRQVIEADLSQYFDTIPHDKLMVLLSERIADGAMLALIKQWLKAPAVIEEKRKRRMAGGKKASRGTPQGGVISPLLSNIYLNLLDRIWDRRNLDKRLQARLVRYADDFVVLCRRDTERPQAWVRAILARMGLLLNPKKTGVCNTYQSGTEFLGFHFQMSKSRKDRWYPLVTPAKSSLTRIRQRIKAITGRERGSIPLAEILGQLNMTVRGWVNYFHFMNCHQAMCNIRHYVEERTRIHLMRRHHIRNRESAYGRFPTRALYQLYDLYKVPTTAGWT